MNKVNLNKDGKLFVNGNEIKDVLSVSIKTTFTGTNIVLEFNGDYKSDYQTNKLLPIAKRSPHKKER